MSRSAGRRKFGLGKAGDVSCAYKAAFLRSGESCREPLRRVLLTSELRNEGRQMRGPQARTMSMRLADSGKADLASAYAAQIVAA